MVELLERLETMIQQENHSYKTVDYLDPTFQKTLTKFNDESLLGPEKSSSLQQSASGINDVWREKICEWSYQVIDHFDFSREVVSVSIHYLDRFLATRPCNKKIFQLAAMTTLFLAIKLYEPGKISMQSMIELSRGYFHVKQMEAMEMTILRALAWKVHPPTAYCFGKHLLYLLPYATVTHDDRHAILELARFLTELSVIDYFFVIHKPSVVAMASLLNAMEEIPGASSVVASFCNELQKTTSLDPTSNEVNECRNRLRLLYVQGGYGSPTAEDPEERAKSVSPVCVSYGCRPAKRSHFESHNPKSRG